MDSEFCKKLAAALGIEPAKPPSPVQELFNRYKKHLDKRIIQSPLPEQIHLLAENFPYWIKLEHPNPANLLETMSAKSNIVVPMLEAGTFNQTGFAFDDSRAKALFNVPELLQSPNCVHRNLRNHDNRGDGGIKGDFMYVRYYGKKKRKVAFTTINPKLGNVILVSSFWTYKGWVEACANMPAVYIIPGGQCTCK
jgi:hypothetical protein